MRAALLFGLALAACASPEGSSELPDAMKVFGDLRLRHESEFGRDGAPDRHRQRVRGRAGLNHQVDEQLLWGLRVVTGDTDDPKSTHVTLGDGFDGLELGLDRLFLEYRAGATRWTAGKFSDPLRRAPVYGELAWDGDVQPEGLAVQQRFGALGPLESFDVVLGGYALLEQGSADDAYVVVGEVSGRSRLGEDAAARVSLSYTFIDDATPDGATEFAQAGRGNAVLDRDADGSPDAFVSDFGVLDLIASLEFEGAGRPWVLSAEALRNLRAEIDDDSGFAAGLAYGRADGPGKWRAWYQWQVVERDAVFGPLAQDDLPLAVDHRSHVAGVDIGLRDDLGLVLWALHSTPEEDEGDAVWRLRLDLNFKF